MSICTGMVSLTLSGFCIVHTMSPPHVGLPGPVHQNGVTTPMFGFAAIIVGISSPSSPAPPSRMLFVEQAGRHSHEGRLPEMVAQASVLRRTPPISPSAAFVPSCDRLAACSSSVASYAMRISSFNFYIVDADYICDFFDLASDYDVVLPSNFCNVLHLCYDSTFALEIAMSHVFYGSFFYPGIIIFHHYQWWIRFKSVTLKEG